MSFARQEIDCAARNEFRHDSITAVESVYTFADAFRILEQLGQIQYFTAEQPTGNSGVNVAKLKAGAVLEDTTLDWTLANIRFHGRRLGLDLATERVRARSLEVDRPARVEAYHIPDGGKLSYQLDPGKVAAVAGLEGEVWLSTSGGDGRLLEPGDVAFNREERYNIVPLAGRAATLLFIAGEPADSDRRPLFAA